MQKPWFKIKRYPHIGMPILPKDVKAIQSYIKDPGKVESHPFLPFIHRTKIQRRFRPEVNNDLIRSKLRFPGEKERDLFYASHVDANIFSYYARMLQENYEVKLQARNLHAVATAYRAVKDPLTQRSMNNVDFAAEIFKEVRDSSEDCVVICMDIKNFFPSLDHTYLKRKWRDIMGFGSSMPNDHYAVFRAITQFSYVNEDEIYETFRKSIIVSSKAGNIRRKPISHIRYLKSENAIAFCEVPGVEVLRDGGLIQSNKREPLKEGSDLYVSRLRGIPQGSSISATLANIYMLDVDSGLHSYAKNVGGIYRRYSDDLIISVPLQYKSEAIRLASKWIADVSLTVQDSKNQIYACKTDGTITDISNPKNYRVGSIEYLGLRFDGRKVYLKSQSLAKYYRKFKRSIRRGEYFSRTIKNKTSGSVFKRKLYKRFTIKGAGRRRLYTQVKEAKTHRITGTRYDWGNFHTYTQMAHATIEQSGLDSGIAKQMGKSWTKFHDYLSR